MLFLVFDTIASSEFVKGKTKETIFLFSESKIKNIAKGTTDLRVEFISQAITQILIKQLIN